MFDRIRMGKSQLLAWLTTCYILFVGSRVLVDQGRAVFDGRWERVVRDLDLEADIVRRREIGPVAPWAKAILLHTPDDAVIGVKFGPDHVVESPVWTSSLRYLTWPRRVLTPTEFLASVESDAGRLSARHFGLQLTNEEPPIPERWKLVARGPRWKLYQWIESP